MKNKIIRLIKKYEGIVLTLKENRDRKTEGDIYPYELDIKLTLEVIEDLSKCLLK